MLLCLGYMWNLKWKSSNFEVKILYSPFLTMFFWEEFEVKILCSLLLIMSLCLGHMWNLKWKSSTHPLNKCTLHLCSAAEAEEFCSALSRAIFYLIFKAVLFIQLSGACENPIFGIPLAMAVDRNKSHDGIKLPAIVRECIDYVEECGQCWNSGFLKKKKNQKIFGCPITCANVLYFYAVDWLSLGLAWVSLIEL